MTNETCSGVNTLELLHQLFASATHDASAAMCRWTSGLITLSLDEVREIPLESVCSEVDVGDDLLTMVVLSLEGNVGGVMILTFDNHNGRELAAALLGQEVSTTEEWTDIEKSALTETGNILGCAYMNALTRLINVALVPSAPYFIQDYGASVLQQALSTQAMTSEHVLICRTGFHRQGEELNWRVFFVPTDAMRDTMAEALKSASPGQFRQHEIHHDKTEGTALRPAK
ncbi:MAG TPA: chemotaxis protein [Thermoguttaceae bacterium]|nr:chemotaxis protein [Thermoguttaceae bacterium]